MEKILEFLPAFVLWGSALYFWIFTTILFVGFVLTDVYENGYMATVLLVGAVIFTSIWTDFRILDYINIPTVFGYLGIGLIYAFLRTYLFGREKKKEWTKEELETYNSVEEVNRWKKARLLDDLKEHVFRWWLLWWASIISWALTDLIKDLFDWVYGKLARLFRSLFELGLK